MAETKQATLHEEVFGDPQHIFANPDPLGALNSDMPSWMTDNLLDAKPEPVVPAEQPKEA